MTAEQIMMNFQTGRMVDALAFIGSILAIWLALRIANMTGENPASNLVTKIVSTGFGACVVLGSYQAYTFAENTFIITARQIQDNIEAAPNPEAAQNFIDFVGKFENLKNDITKLNNISTKTVEHVKLNNSLNFAFILSICSFGTSLCFVTPSSECSSSPCNQVCFSHIVDNQSPK